MLLELELVLKGLEIQSETFQIGGNRYAYSTTNRTLQVDGTAARSTQISRLCSFVIREDGYCTCSSLPDSSDETAFCSCFCFSPTFSNF